MVNPQAFYSSCFRANSHFEDDGTQNYLVFLLVCRYPKTAPNHYLKIVHIRSISSTYFPVFGLNRQIYFVNLCIQIE